MERLLCMHTQAFCTWCCVVTIKIEIVVIYLGTSVLLTAIRVIQYSMVLCSLSCGHHTCLAACKEPSGPTPSDISRSSSSLMLSPEKSDSSSDQPKSSSPMSASLLALSQDTFSSMNRSLMLTGESCGKSISNFPPPQRPPHRFPGITPMMTSSRNSSLEIRVSYKASSRGQGAAWHGRTASTGKQRTGAVQARQKQADKCERERVR